MIIQSSFSDSQPWNSYLHQLQIASEDRPFNPKKMMNHLPLEFWTVNSLWGFFFGKFIYVPWNCLWLPFWLEKSIPFFFWEWLCEVYILTEITPGSSDGSLLAKTLTRPELWGRFFHLPWWVLNGIKKCLLGQWLNFKLFGMTYFVGKTKFQLLFQGPLAKWEWLGFFWGGMVYFILRAWCH